MTKPYAFARQWQNGPQKRALAKPRFDVASLVDIGARTSQQDAVVANFPKGEDIGIGIIADGMGGHLGGEMASHLALCAAFAETKLQMVRYRAGQVLLPQALGKAVERANRAISDHVACASDLKGMGTTLVICVAAGPDLYWASVGDSPLYLYRDGMLKRLNEDHSMGPQIDAMAASGLINAKDAAEHPQRNQLVSAICGSPVARVDCAQKPFQLRTGDILLLASDGIQTLSDDEIARLLRKKRRGTCDEISRALLQAVDDAGNAEQDNISMVVLRLECDDPLPMPPVPAPEETGAHSKLGGLKFADDPDFEEASDLLNKALLL